MMSQPIKPSEVGPKKAQTMPPEVFEAFNELIVKHWDGRSATVLQSDVVNLILAKMTLSKPEIKRSDLYDNHYLDVESHYRKAGWVVKYDSPACNESYPATFEFRKKSRAKPPSGGDFVGFGCLVA